MNINQFVGKQLSRMRYAQTYAAMVMQMVSAIGILTLALGELNVDLTIAQFIYVILISTFAYWLLGFLIDRLEIKKGEVANDIKQSMDFTRQIYKQAYKDAIIELKKEGIL